MRQLRPFRLGLRLVSLLLLLAAAALAYREWTRFQAARLLFPPGSTIAGMPVGGLDRQAAVERLQQAYSLPVELRYAGAPIHLEPQAAGFRLELEEMLPPEGSQSGLAADWPAFRAFLWGESPPPVDLPLRYTLSEQRLRAALEEIAARYDRPALPARPLPARVDFQSGVPGAALDIEAAIPPLVQALPSLSNREVDLPIREVPPGRPSLENLQILLQQIIASEGFDGLADVYLAGLQSGEGFQFAIRRGQALSIQPDIPFSASSIIKIPILISVFRRLEGSPDELVDGWLRAMFTQSSNDAADALMKYAIDEVRGPLVVSEDLQALGVENTFLAGYFAPGSPLLQIFHTPANQRPDVGTAPDIYNQATPADIGSLLQDIYRCARSGDGRLASAFQGEITSEECRQMIEYMKLDREPYLLKAALPEGTPAARKHGYGSTAAGVINTIGDAGILFTPGGDYVLVIFLNNPDLLLFDPANALMARLSLAVYNYFNL